MADVDEAVRRILRVKARLGLFARPYADETKAAGAPDAKARAAARAAAERSLVLLKNDGAVLPFSKSLKSVAVIGPAADDGAAVLGSWSSDGRPAEAVTVLAGIKALLPKARVEFVAGCPVAGDCAGGVERAVAAARAADAVVLVLGESADMSGEASARASIELPGRQEELAEAVLAAGRPAAVVLLNGRPLAIPRLAERAPAILEAWQPGTEGGAAVARTLFGDVVPGGKLPMTFPRSTGQIPLYYAHKSTGRPPEESNHYSSKYLDLPWTPQFPFGHGLSYTTFALDSLNVKPATIARDGRAEATVWVKNVGTRTGDEVVQLYIHHKAGSVTPAVRELKGFARVTLKPGERRAVIFALTPSELGLVGLDGRWTVEPGAVEVFAGQSSVGGLRSELTIE